MLLQDQIENTLMEMGKVSSHEKEILKLIVSEFQRRPNLKVKLEDDKVYQIINKYIKNNEELLKYAKTDEEKTKIVNENNYLLTFLPKSVSENEIKEFLKTLDINDKNKNKFIGVVIKHFKEKDYLVDGALVKNILNS